MSGHLWGGLSRLGAVILLAGVVLGAGVGDVPATAEAQAAVQTVRVELSEWMIRPQTVTLRAGQRYRFELVNMGQFRHSLEFEGMASSQGPMLAAGETGSYEFVPTRSGQVTVFCPVACPGPNCHRDRGMAESWTVLAAVGQLPSSLPQTGGATLPLVGLAGVALGAVGLALRRLHGPR